MQKIVCLLIFFIFVSDINAQDVGFTQFYSNPVLLNPAMAGNTDCPTFIANYRRQTLLANNFSTYALTADFNAKRYNSGFSLNIVKDDQGNGTVSSLQVGADYSYRLKISNIISLKAGLETNVYQRKINYQNLVFPDQLTPVSGVHNPTVENIGVQNSVLYVDFAAGVVLYNKKYYFGLTVHHLTEPSHTAASSSSDYVVLYRKYTMHAGLNFEMNKTAFDEGFLLSPALIIEQQSDFQRISYGAYVEKNSVIGGLWVKHNLKFKFSSVALLVGYSGDWYKIGYSYDLPFSSWGNSPNQVSAHELSLTFFPTCNLRKNSLKRAVLCPEF